MRIATDTLGKAKTRRPEAERHKQRDEHATICPRECLSPYMGKVAVRTARFLARTRDRSHEIKPFAGLIFYYRKYR